MKAKGKNIFIKLNIESIMNVNFVDLKDKKIASVSRFKDENTQNAINENERRILFCKKASGADICLIKIMKNTDNMNDANVTIVILVLMSVFLSLLFERKRIVEVSKPISPKSPIIPITDTSVVANPTSFAGNILATKSQNTKPKPAITAVASIG
jgi:hypothetical protein